MSLEPALIGKVASNFNDWQKLCIHEIFELQVARTPEAVAVKCGEEEVSYRALNERANRLARNLNELGVGSEIPVVLFLERSIEMVVAILGVLKAGGAYVPVDLAYPSERFAFMLEDTQAPVIVTQEKLMHQIPECHSQILCIDSQKQNVHETGQDMVVSAAGPSNAAYIIYTSGSTGKPKGVLVTHRNVVRLLTETEHWYGFNPSDVWPLFHSYAFDVSVWELWGTLFYGGRLVIVPYLVSRSPQDFYALLSAEGVTVLNQTPSAFRQLIWAEASAPAKLPLNLRYVICAGEALELQSLKPWFDLHGDEKPKIVNKYGITEITVHATYRVIRRADLTSGVGSVIGVPIPDLQLHLVDENLRRVPPGVPGEICVSGAGVARGYLNRPELTSQRFLPDPFSSEAGTTMYRSGDLAQISPTTGELEYLGRMDHQVKIRGFRVELGEIESGLNRHPRVRESVVMAIDGTEGEKRLVGYVVLRNEGSAGSTTITDLRGFLGRTIPEYMIPAFFVFLETLPLTTNGKVDRRALPTPDGIRPQLGRQFVKPRNKPEHVLAEIWAEVLQIDRVGVHDNYFELGGDSIRSIRILAKAQQRGLSLTLQQIFKHPTIAELAACAPASHAQSIIEKTTPFQLISNEDRAKLPADIENAYPIAALQLGMFFQNELRPESAIYHDVFSFCIKAKLDREKLETAINRLLDRHPILRTSFHLAGFSDALQLVHLKAVAPITFENLRASTPEARKQAVIDWVEAERHRPFERDKAPLLRFHVQWQTDKTFQFIISFHHSCLDGWSLAAVITEIFEEYSALIQNAEKNLQSPRLRYADFVALEKQATTSEECRQFWSRKLEGAALQRVPRWPKALRTGDSQQRRGPEIQIDSATFEGLRRAAQLAGVPLKTVLLAAHQRVMSFLYGQPDVVSGLLCNGRPEDLDGERIIGLFLNTLPVRQQLEGGTWLELIQDTYAAEQEIIPHRRLPLAEIQKLNHHQPVFETGFDFVHFHVYKSLQGCSDLDLAEGHYFEANDLTLFTTFILDAVSEQLQMHLDYDPNELCREQVERFTDYYLATLREMARDPQGRYETFSPLPDDEREQMLVQWNATEAEYPATRCIHELFEDRVLESPEALALAFENQKLTYADLNSRAEAIAQQLGTLGVGPEKLVGICMERSPAMVAALLGVLKTGGAYLPLDPAFPSERLAMMLEDAKPSALISESHLLNKIGNIEAPILCLDAGKSEIIRSRVPAGGIDSGNLAYVIFTSGSTGKPKAVQVTHKSVVNLLISAQKKIGVGSTDNLLAVTTLSFDIAALELFMPLINGATLSLASRDIAADGTRLAALIESSGATVMQATPATWRLLIESGWVGNKSLKVLCGGEALKRNLADQLLARCSQVWNFFGPTETTIWSSCWKVVPDAAMSIGRPLGNTQMYVLDKRLSPVPAGAVGELHIGGDGLARGYLNRPELTAEKFIPDPFSDDPNRRIYRTGDLARFLPDGNIECLGRIDHQVKVHGFRIELGEVETVLRQHAGIADALVTVCENSLGEKQLVGYIISRNGPPSISELREFLMTKLPQYMVPAHFVVLSQFPLNSNGKIDLRLLPSPETHSQPVRSYVAPRTQDEHTLARIWQEVLLCPQVGIEDNFFELGGDSLSATRAFARTNQLLEANLTLREMFEHPTIASLAGVLLSPTRRVVSARPILPRRARHQDFGLQPNAAGDAKTCVSN